MGEWMPWGGGSAVRELGNLHSEGQTQAHPHSCPQLRRALPVSLHLAFFLLTINGLI